MAMPMPIAIAICGATKPLLPVPPEPLLPWANALLGGALAAPPEMLGRAMAKGNALPAAPAAWPRTAANPRLL